MFIYLIGEFGCKNRGQSETNPQANISKTAHSGSEMICVREKLWKMKRNQLAERKGQGEGGFQTYRERW